MIRKHKIYTVDFCKERLELWLKAEEAVATGQRYKIGSRDLTRADLLQIREEIEFWENKLDKAEKEELGINTKARRVIRVVPRDL